MSRSFQMHDVRRSIQGTPITKFVNAPNPQQSKENPQPVFKAHTTVPQQTLAVPTNQSKEVKPKSLAVIYHEEQRFLECLAKTNQLEDPLLLWSKYYKWARVNFPNNEEKQFDVLNRLTRELSQNERYKQDPSYVSKWTSYAKLCIDQEEILKYMEENDIGTQLAMFYKAYAVVYIRKRNFSLANDWALAGKKKGAKPESKMADFMKEFEENMRERLHRDFYNFGKKLTDEDLVDVPVVYPNQKDGSTLLDDLDLNDESVGNQSLDKLTSFSENMNLKRKYPYGNNPKENVKKVKLNDLVNSVKMGEFNIYVDQEYREAIPESTKLVNEYDALCYKYNFSLSPPPPEGKFYSWVSQQIPQSEASISLDMSNTGNSFSILKDDTNVQANPLVAQFQLPKNLRKPLREIKVIKPSPVQVQVQSQDQAQAQEQTSEQNNFVFLFEKNSQEIAEHYIPKMSSILEEGPEEPPQEEKELGASVFDTLTSIDEKSLQAKNVNSSSEVSTSCDGTREKKSSSRKVTLPTDAIDSSDKKVRMKIRKTPYHPRRSFAKEEEEEEEEVEKEKEANNQVKPVSLWDKLHDDIPEIPVPTVSNKHFPSIFSPLRMPEPTRSLNFSEISVDEDEERATRAEETLRRSPLYTNLFGEEQACQTRLPQNQHRAHQHQTNQSLESRISREEREVEKKPAAKKVVKTIKEPKMIEMAMNKGIGKEIKKRIIPEIYRNDSFENKGNQEFGDFERYLLGVANWKGTKEVNSPKRETNENDDLSDLLFSMPQGHYLK